MEFKFYHQKKFIEQKNLNQLINSLLTVNLIPSLGYEKMLALRKL